MIRLAGYTCDQVTYSRFAGVGYRGLEFQVDCNDSLYQYKMLVTNDDCLVVTPWR